MLSVVNNLQELRALFLKAPEFRHKARLPVRQSVSWPLSQIFVVHPGKLLYCPIGKNACTFLKQVMVRIAQPENMEYILASVHARTDHAHTGLLLGDYPAEGVRALIHSEEFYKFAVWRDPILTAGTPR